jgi:hypothetical protein
MCGKSVPPPDRIATFVLYSRRNYETFRRTFFANTLVSGGPDMFTTAAAASVAVAICADQNYLSIVFNLPLLGLFMMVFFIFFMMN